jgi:hypothetical protein
MRQYSAMRLYTLMRARQPKALNAILVFHSKYSKPQAASSQPASSTPVSDKNFS